RRHVPRAGFERACDRFRNAAVVQQVRETAAEGAQISARAARTLAHEELCVAIELIDRSLSGLPRGSQPDAVRNMPAEGHADLVCRSRHLQVGVAWDAPDLDEVEAGGSILADDTIGRFGRARLVLAEPGARGEQRRPNELAGSDAIAQA